MKSETKIPFLIASLPGFLPLMLIVFAIILLISRAHFSESASDLEIHWSSASFVTVKTVENRPVFYRSASHQKEGVAPLREKRKGTPGQQGKISSGVYRAHSYGWGEVSCVFPPNRAAKGKRAPCRDGLGLKTASGEMFSTRRVAVAWSGFRAGMKPFYLCMRAPGNRPVFVLVNDRKAANGVPFDMTPGAVSALIPGADHWSDLPRTIEVVPSGYCREALNSPNIL